MSTEIRVRATIEVDDREAEMLAHLCSWDLARVFAEKFSHKYKAGEIKDCLADIRGWAELIVKARNKAEEAARETLS